MFHVAPEFLSAAALMSLNARRVFGTGPWGDRLTKDPKPKPEEGESATKAKAGTTWAGRAWDRMKGSMRK